MTEKRKFGVSFADRCFFKGCHTLHTPVVTALAVLLKFGEIFQEISTRESLKSFKWLMQDILNRCFGYST